MLIALLDPPLLGIYSFKVHDTVRPHSYEKEGFQKTRNDLVKSKGVDLTGRCAVELDARSSNRFQI